MVKLIFYVIILIFLFKKLLKAYNNLTYKIKYMIKGKKIKKQKKLKQEDIKQEEFKQVFPEITKSNKEILKPKELNQQEIEEKRKQEEFKKNFPEIAKYSEEILKPKELNQQEIEEKRKQEEFKKKFPEIAKYREEVQKQKDLLEIEEARAKQYEQWQNDIKHGKIVIQGNSTEIKTQKKAISENSMFYIDNLDNGYKFEEYTAKLLKKLGYKNIEITSSSGDHGADLLAEKDSITYAIQCKWSSFGKNNIGNKAVQEIYAGKTYYNKNLRNSFNKQFLYEISKERSRKI